MHQLIINSDDFGYSPGVNAAILHSHKFGVLTSTTLMANGTYFDEAVEMAKQTPTLGVGVHLVLTYGRPLLKDVPSLVDEEGNFFKYKQFHEGLTVEKEDLYREWNAQIQKVLDAGIKPTHLDSHHHSHTFHANHLDVISELAKKYNLPVRGNAPLDGEIKTTATFVEDFDFIGMESEKKQQQYFEQLIKEIKNHESTEIMCHTGFLDAFLLTSSSFTEPRMYQVEQLTTSDFTKALKEDPKIKLTTFSKI